jgi:hypothetical protein
LVGEKTDSAVIYYLVSRQKSGTPIPAFVMKPGRIAGTFFVSILFR